MADLNERLDRLISDQDSMKRVLDMARTILAQRDSPGTASAEEASVVPEPSAAPDNSGPDLTSLLSGLLGQQSAGQTPPEEAVGSSQTTASPLGGAALAAILPQLMQAMSGQGDLVRQERANLVRAMQPYLKDSRGSSIERALRMANMAKAATNALHTLGR